MLAYVRYEPLHPHHGKVSPRGRAELEQRDRYVIYKHDIWTSNGPKEKQKRRLWLQDDHHETPLYFN